MISVKLYLDLLEQFFLQNSLFHLWLAWSNYRSCIIFTPLSSTCFLHNKISDSNLFPHIKGKKISIVCKHCVCMYVWEVFCNVDAAIALWATASKTRIMSWRCPVSGSSCGTVKPPCIFVPAVKKYIFQAFWKWHLLLSGGDLICNEELFYWLYWKSRRCCLAESCP